MSHATEAISRRIHGIPQWVRWMRTSYPPGHFHSPLPDLAEIRHNEGYPFAVPEHLPGIDLRAAAQLDQLPEMALYAAEAPWADTARTGLRYYLRNPWFAFGDGVALHCMLRRLQPKRYVEIGSGFSSACALDTAAMMGESPEFTFVDPNPERLHTLLRDGDNATVIPRRLADIDPAVIGALEPGDVLMIDSSHVSKAGSDVNELFLNIIPKLPAGVHVHVHDIFWPFQQRRDWLLKGWAWNECHLLHAMLINNPHVRIEWFNSYLGQFHREQVAGALPKWGVDPGSSIWLETV